MSTVAIVQGMLSLPKELNNVSKEDPVDGKEYYHPMVEE